MELTASATASFNAGHKIPALLACTRQHGHFYEIEVTVRGELDPTHGWPRGTEGLTDSVRELALEFNGRDLSEMMPGVVTTPAGMAAQFMERLASQMPSIIAIEVRCSDDTSGRATRTLR